MALHGELKVNNHVIGVWEAVRREEVSPGQYRYDTVLDLNHRETVGSVVHDYADGAAVLASKVLLTGSAAVVRFSD